MEEVDTPMRENIRDRENRDMMDQLVERMTQLQAPKKDFKPPTYNGETDVEIFLTQFKDIALINRWEPLETLLHLRGCLQGRAVDCGRETNLQDTYDSLRARFGLTPKQAREQLKTIKKRPKQSYHELSSEISRLVQIAHSGESAEFKKNTLLETYSTAVVYAPLRQHLLARPHDTLAEAVAISDDYMRIEDTKARLAAATGGVEPTGDMSSIQEQLNMMKQMIVELAQNRPPTTQSYQQRQVKPGPCYHCRGDHLKRNCPHLPPRTAPPNHQPAQLTTTHNYGQPEQRNKPEPAWPTTNQVQAQQTQPTENYQGLAQ